MPSYLVVQDTMENEKYNTLRKSRREIFLCDAGSFPFVVSLLTKRNGPVKLKSWEGFATDMLTFADDRNMINSSRCLPLFCGSSPFCFRNWLYVDLVRQKERFGWRKNWIPWRIYSSTFGRLCFPLPKWPPWRHVEMIRRVTRWWYHRLNGTPVSKMLGDVMWKYSNVNSGLY